MVTINVLRNIIFLHCSMIKNDRGFGQQGILGFPPTFTSSSFFFPDQHFSQTLFVNCRRIFSSPILIYFFSGSAGCVFDYVEIFDGQGTNDTSLGRFCGNIKPAPLSSSTNVLLMKFVSDQSITQTGFVSTYTAEPAGG